MKRSREERQKAVGGGKGGVGGKGKSSLGKGAKGSKGGEGSKQGKKGTELAATTGARGVAATRSGGGQQEPDQVQMNVSSL